MMPTGTTYPLEQSRWKVIRTKYRCGMCFAISFHEFEYFQAHLYVFVYYEDVCDYFKTIKSYIFPIGLDVVFMQYITYENATKPIILTFFFCY